MAKKHTESEFVELLINDPYKKKVMAARESAEQRRLLQLQENTIDPYSIIQSAKKSKMQQVKYRQDLKESLLYETLYTLVSGGIPQNVVSEDTPLMVSQVVSAFIKEEGADRLINSFRTKTLFLSEVNKQITDILSGESIPEDTSDDLKSSFKKGLKGTELDDIIDTIRTRVANSLDEFITSNTKDKLKIKEILNQTQEKVNKAKSEAMKEAAEMRAKRAIKDIKNSREQGLLEYMINKAGKAAFNEQNLRESYIDGSGNLIVDKLVENCVVAYTLLETLNTAKIKKIDENYISKFLE